MSIQEILDEIPRLSFAERQVLIQRAMAMDEEKLTLEEETILDARMEDFRRNPHSGISLDQLKTQVAKAIEEND